MGNSVTQASQLTASPLQAKFQDHCQRPGMVGCNQPLYFIRSESDVKGFERSPGFYPVFIGNHHKFLSKEGAGSRK